MQIAEIWRYPVKSMAGERLPRARLGLEGIPGDRVLYVVDGRGEILSARTRPRLLKHHARLDRRRRRARRRPAVAQRGGGRSRARGRRRRRATRGGRRARAIRHPAAARRHRWCDRRVRLRPATAAAEPRDRRRRRPGRARLGGSPGRRRRCGDRPRRPPRALHHHHLGSGHADPGRRRPPRASARSSTARWRSMPGPGVRATCRSATRSCCSISRSSSRCRRSVGSRRRAGTARAARPGGGGRRG